MFFFKQKTAYEMRISDWSSDVCSSDLYWRGAGQYRISRIARHCSELETCHRSVCYRLETPPQFHRRYDFYASYARGYKGGGANPPGIGADPDQLQFVAQRSAERREGKEGVSTCRSWWSRYN